MPQAARKQTSSGTDCYESLSRADHGSADDSFQRHALADGHEVELSENRVRVFDPEGELLIAFENGHAAIRAPRGDLKLSAPHGRLEIEAGHDIALKASRDVLLSAERQMEMVSGKSLFRQDPSSMAFTSANLLLQAEEAKLNLGRASLVADRVTSAVQRVAHRIDEYQLDTQRIVERSESTYREVRDVLQQRIGRMKTRVDGVLNWRSKRTVMLSDEETSIDGERILLG